jgi:hypothetical protein
VPGWQVRVIDRPERAATQVQFGLDVVAGVQRANLDVAQQVTRACP